MSRKDNGKPAADKAGNSQKPLSSLSSSDGNPLTGSENPSPDSILATEIESILAEEKVRIEPFSLALGEQSPPPFTVLQGDDLVKWTVGRNRKIDGVGQYLTPFYWEMGGGLDKLQQDLQYGAYGRWERSLKRWGIQRTRATKAMAIYDRYDTVDQCRQLSVGKAYTASARKGRSKKSRQPPADNPQPTGAAYSPAKDIKLVCCPFADLEVEPASVHLVPTDPPWGKDWIEEDLPRFAEFCARVLVEGGIVAAWYSNSCLDEFIRVFKGAGLTWQHMLVCPFEQPGLLDGTRQFIQHHDLCLVFSKGGFALEKPVVDLLPTAEKEKDLHPWQRSRAQMDYLVRSFSRTGDLVCDPCLGSGTSAESCLVLGRRFVGCDRDPACAEQWKQRFNRVNQRLYDELHDDAVSEGGDDPDEPGAEETVVRDAREEQ